MTSLLKKEISSPPSMPWADPGFILPVVAIPVFTLLGMLLWQADARSAFRIVQLSFGWAVVAQMAFVLSRAFQRGWFELFAYVLHLVAIGAASLTVTFRLGQYSQDMLYDQMALLGLAGQLMIGVMMLANGPIRQQARLDPRALTVCAVIVCTAALLKFGFYIRYVGLSGGYTDVYTEGDALRDSSPALVRILAAGAPLIGLLALTQPGLPRWCRFLGLLSIVLEFFVGIRSRPLFIILSALVVFQSRIKFTKLNKIFIVLAALFFVFVIAAIGYYRENYHSTAYEYFWIVLESLFGIFEAGVFGIQIPHTGHLVLGQIVPLLAPTSLYKIDTVAKLLSATYTPTAYVVGYGYSSSALTEVTMLLGPVLSGFAYPAAVFIILVIIKSAITSRRTPFFLYGACVLPIAFYIWRAELWQLAIPAIKALPFITILLGTDAFARLDRRDQTASPPTMKSPRLP